MILCLIFQHFIFFLSFFLTLFATTLFFFLVLYVCLGLITILLRSFSFWFLVFFFVFFFKFCLEQNQIVLLSAIIIIIVIICLFLNVYCAAMHKNHWHQNTEKIYIVLQEYVCDVQYIKKTKNFSHRYSRSMYFVHTLIVAQTTHTHIFRK